MSIRETRKGLYKKMSPERKVMEVMLKNVALTFLELQGVEKGCSVILFFVNYHEKGGVEWMFAVLEKHAGG